MPRITRNMLILFSILLVVLAAGDAEASQYKRIRNISVACTDGLSCDLSGYNAQSELYTVIFRRAAGSEAPLRLVLGVRETLASGSDVSFNVDGAEILRLPVSELSYRAAVYEYHFLGKAEISALVEAAKAGQELRISFRARGADAVVSFSLEGFAEGLAFMDEAQGRTVRESASAEAGAAGGKPRAIKSFADIPFQFRAEFSTRESAICGGLEEEQFAGLGGFEADLGGDSIFGLPCRAGEGLNQAYAFWVREGSRFRAVAFPVMTPEGPTTEYEAWNIAWNQEKLELVSVFQGGGADACGAYNRWAWRERDGWSAFVLVEARVDADCENTAAGGPANWPLVWPPDG